MGFLSGITDAIGLTGGRQKSRSTTQMWTPEQQNISKKLADFLTPRIGTGATAYTKDRVAGMSGAEKRSGAWLDTYLAKGAPEQWKWADAGVKKALNQNYGAIVDPSQTRGVYDWAVGQATGALNDAQRSPIINTDATDKLYAAIKDQVLSTELPELQDRIAANANLSGMYHSGTHSGQQHELVGDVTTRLANTLANLRHQDEQQRRQIEREREGRTYATLDSILRSTQGQRHRDIATGQDVARDREARSFAAVPLAMDIGRAQDRLPVERAAAGYAYGSLPRELEQRQLDADFEEFLRTLPENSPFIEQALAYLARQGTQTTRGSMYDSKGIVEALMPFI